MGSFVCEDILWGEDGCEMGWELSLVRGGILFLKSFEVVFLCKDF